MFNLVENPLILLQDRSQFGLAESCGRSRSSRIICSSPSSPSPQSSSASASFPFSIRRDTVKDLRKLSSAVEEEQKRRAGRSSSSQRTRAASLSNVDPSFIFSDSQNGVPTKRVTQNGSGIRQPVDVSAKGKWSKLNESSLSGDEALPLPMTWPGSEPVAKEKVDEMLKCDPEIQNCKDVVYQWVGDCKTCQGTGYVSFYRKRHEVISKCINCLGIGSVHKITSRADVQDMDGTNGSSRGSANGRPGSNGKA